MRLLSLRKEAALTFLAVFYFLIATNTQTGWLFLMSAFMLGVLAMSWAAPRAALSRLSLERQSLHSPQRGVPMAVQLRLKNMGGGVLREVRVEQPGQDWAENGDPFRWVVPRLKGGAEAVTEFRLTPQLRGEHRLVGTRVICGAPFGLFTVYRELEASEPFLVYPKLELLPSRPRRSRLAGILTELSAPHKKGDSRTLRSLREYQPGDDLRLVHWKSSAKRGQASLLVREHQSPTHQMSLVVLANHGERDESTDPAFEKAVSLTASVLWSAHRAGTRSCLVYLDGEGEWQFIRRWQEQFVALARVQRTSHLDFSSWQESAGRALQANPLSRLARPVVFARLTAPELLDQPWPEWPEAVVTCLPEPEAKSFPARAGLIAVDADRAGLRELPLG